MNSAHDRTHSARQRSSCEVRRASMQRIRRCVTAQRELRSSKFVGHRLRGLSSIPCAPCRQVPQPAPSAPRAPSCSFPATKPGINRTVWLCRRRFSPAPVSPRRRSTSRSRDWMRRRWLARGSSVSRCPCTPRCRLGMRAAAEMRALNPPHYLLPRALRGAQCQWLLAHGGDSAIGGEAEQGAGGAGRSAGAWASRRTSRA